MHNSHESVFFFYPDSTFVLIFREFLLQKVMMWPTKLIFSRYDLIQPWKCNQVSQFSWDIISQETETKQNKLCLLVVKHRSLIYWLWPQMKINQNGINNGCVWHGGINATAAKLPRLHFTTMKCFLFFFCWVLCNIITRNGITSHVDWKIVYAVVEWMWIMWEQIREEADDIMRKWRTGPNRGPVWSEDSTVWQQKSSTTMRGRIKTKEKPQLPVLKPQTIHLS